MTRLRKMESIKLSNANKQTLKKHFESIYGFTPKGIKEIRIVLGANTNEEAYEILRDDYNSQIENKQKEKKKQTRKAYIEKKNKPEIAYTNTVILDYNKIVNEGYNVFTNSIELDRMVKVCKNKENLLFQQKVNFYDNDGNLINGNYAVINTETGETELYIDIEPYTFETQKVTNEFKEKIIMKMRTGSEGIWKPAFIVGTYEGYGSDLNIGPNAYTEIISTAFKPIIKKSTKKQTYRDNDTGTCVYDATLKYFERQLQNRHANATYNKLIEQKDKFAKSYTDETIEKELAPFCKSSFTIKNLITGKDIKLNENSGNRFSIELLNTKYNHLDLLTHSYNEPEIVEEEEYIKIKQTSKFYIEKMGKLITLDKTYKKKESEFKQIYNEWFNDNNMSNKYIYTNTDEYKMLDRYDMNIHTFINNYEIQDNLYEEIDLRKAYFNYWDNEFNAYYKGVPSGAFQNVKCNENFDFELITKNGFVGFYQVKILSSDLDYRLGFTEGTIHYLFTSMIELLLENDVELEFMNASYSTSINIPFTEDFLEEEKGIKHYCKAFGIMLCENSTIDVVVKPLKCDLNYFETLQDENLHLYKDFDKVKIQYKNKKAKTYKHIAYSIHAYTQTLILKQLINSNLDDVFGIKLDSIVYKKGSHYNFNKTQFKFKEGKVEGLLLSEYVKCDKAIKNNEDDNRPSCITDEEWKKIKEHQKLMEEGEEFLEDYETINSGFYRVYKLSADKRDLNFNNPFTQTNEYIIQRIVFLGGKGGSGKTTSCLRNLNFQNTCYTTMCWNLIQGKMTEYKGLHGWSIQKLIGDKCEKIIDNSIRHLIIDEATLINADDITKIINEYPNAFIYILGDIDYDGFYYQCAVVKNIINPSTINNLQYIKYFKSYRFNDELNGKLDILREVMRSGGDINKCVQKHFANCFYAKEDIIFGDFDVGITALDDTKNNNEWTNYFISKGAKPRYYVKKTNVNKNQLRGREIDSVEDTNNYEEKLFKTIHSFQGLDLTHDNNIIIIMNSLFDKNLFYTALSRARRLDQIKIYMNIINRYASFRIKKS